MKAVGIICEYNPFHNGHIHHLNEIKKHFENYAIVLVLSGSFTQRGEVSILNKWDKTEISLMAGVDLVVELPFLYVCESADIFADAAIQILEALQVEYLVFGSEINHIETLKQMAFLEPIDIKKDLKKGFSYAAAMNLSFEKRDFHLSGPNDLLGISYIRAIERQKSSIIPFSIQRTNSYHSLESNSSIISAKAIRNLLKENKDVSSFVPPYVLPFLKTTVQEEAYFPFLKYKILTEKEHLQEYQLVEEGIENRILKYAYLSSSYEEFIQNIKTKRYTYTRIHRTLTNILCGIKKEHFQKNVSYLRILGFSKKGKQYLKEKKKNISIPLLSNYHPLCKLDLQATCAYACVLKGDLQKNIIEKEYKNPPIQK